MPRRLLSTTLALTGRHSLHMHGTPIVTVIVWSTLAPSLKGPAMPDFSGVPRDYWDVKEVFSKEKAQILLPHREFDCGINLLPASPTYLPGFEEGNRREKEEFLGPVLKVRVWGKGLEEMSQS
ncbi:hypothetical protein AOLI_G00040480 [Acnodon oligacanthus]